MLVEEGVLLQTPEVPLLVDEEDLPQLPVMQPRVEEGGLPQLHVVQAPPVELLVVGDRLEVVEARGQLVVELQQAERLRKATSRPPHPDDLQAQLMMGEGPESLQ